MTKNVVAGALILSTIFITSCGTQTELQSNTNAMTSAMENINENITLDSLDLEYSSNTNAALSPINMNASMEDDMGLSMNGSVGSIVNMNVNEAAMSSEVELEGTTMMDSFDTSEGTTSSMN